MYLMVNTKQKPRVDLQKIRKGENAYHHGITRLQRQAETRKKDIMELRGSQNSINNIALVSSYISMSTLNINELNLPIKDTKSMD